MKAIFRSPPVVSVLAWLIWAWMACIAHTVRWRIEGTSEAREALAAAGSPGVVITCWHETLLLMPSGWIRALRHWPERQARAAMMVSLSPDGQAIARAVQRLDIDVIRGSSGNRRKAAKDKGGARAIAEACAHLRRGGYVCVTPDGPRGPRRVASPGAVMMARRAGGMVLPYALAIRPAIRLGSWDRLLVPLPFSRGAIVFADPIACPTQVPVEDLQAALQKAMEKATGRAEDLAG